MSTFGPTTTTSDTTEGPNWRPLDRIQRRVAGVLVEKAKTTPENYPLSLNAITTGSNQKSNRSPQMDLDPSDVELALEELREMGAVVEIQGDGRVAKFKHCLYDWLGVDKVEMAVMAELMLRGEQTVGELRGRAGRMEAIADLNALRPVLNSLIDKKLVISLTPEGRGQVVTHGLYQPSEMPKVNVRAGEIFASSSSRPASAPRISEDVVAALREQIAELRQEVARLNERLNILES
ncbi:MAG: DUF480 domain-containing protein [Planctomycetota bacterium]|nr:DUF480 domain-containing protein [Planctomycetota bacterium]